MTERVLLAVDESKASDQATAYLASWLKGTGMTVRVTHALPQIPATDKATVGGDKPPSRAERWLAMSREEAQPSLFRAVEKLKSEGMDPASIEDAFLYLDPGVTAAEGLLEFAQKEGCDTIVVGRNALPWHRELFHHHIADELIRKADHCTVWVVE